MTESDPPQSEASGKFFKALDETAPLALADVEEAGSRSVEVLALDEALEELDAINERQRRVVEMRFFGGLSDAEISQVLEVSARTVRLDWHNARVWLRQKLLG